MRRFLTIPAVAALAVGSATAIAADAPQSNWGDVSDPITQRPEYAHSKAVCRRLRNLTPPVADHPAPGDLAGLQGCSAAAFYYGIGVEPDPVRARRCAFVEQADDGRPFVGTAMLMTIYANGVGGKRDLDLATALACRLNGAPAEMDGRVDHLQRLNAQAWTGHDFDYCDDITSGIASGDCAGLAASIEAAKRAAELAELTKDWPERDRRAYAALADAETAYATASSENEVDLGGTARVAFMIEQKQSIDKDFLKLIQALAAQVEPNFTVLEIATADERVVKTFDQVMAARNPIWGTVEKAGIRTTQKVWERYRDAWGAFAEIRYTKAVSGSIRTAVTQKRIDALAGFLD